MVQQWYFKTIEIKDQKKPFSMEIKNNNYIPTPPPPMGLGNGDNLEDCAQKGCRNKIWTENPLNSVENENTLNKNWFSQS